MIINTNKETNQPRYQCTASSLVNNLEMAKSSECLKVTWTSKIKFQNETTLENGPRKVHDHHSSMFALKAHDFIRTQRGTRCRRKQPKQRPLLVAQPLDQPSVVATVINGVQHKKKNNITDTISFS